MGFSAAAAEVGVLQIGSDQLSEVECGGEASVGLLGFAGLLLPPAAPAARLLFVGLARDPQPQGLVVAGAGQP
jgi:hypothetical protein